MKLADTLVALCIVFTISWIVADGTAAWSSRGLDKHQYYVTYGFTMHNGQSGNGSATLREYPIANKFEVGRVRRHIFNIDTNYSMVVVLNWRRYE